MDRVAGEEHAAFAIALRQQQVLLPLADIERVELQRHSDGLREHRRHVGVAVDDGMQGEMPGRILHDQLGRVIVGDMIVPTLTDRDAIEEALAVMQRLPQLQHTVFIAGQLYSELLAHHAGAAIAADQIGRADRRSHAGKILYRRGHGTRVLRERQQFVAVAYCYARQRLRHRFQQWLQRVLRDQLIGLERQRAVMRRGDLRLQFGDRRIFLVQQWRVDHVLQHNENIHRHISGQSGSADLIRQPHAPIDFHAARVAALHFRQELRRFLLLDQRAANAAHAEIDRERKPGRSGAGDDDLGIHSLVLPSYRRSSTRTRGTALHAETPLDQSRATISPSSTWMVFTSV